MKNFLCLIALLLFFTSCASVEKKVGQMACKIDHKETAAVSWIYESKTGDITALGNLWRDRLQSMLEEHGIVIKSRKDIVILIDDISSFGLSDDEKKIWEQADADIVVCGNYRVIPPEQNSDKYKIGLYIKAFRVNDSTLIDSFEIIKDLESGWENLSCKVHGNVFPEKLKVVSPGKGENSPMLIANLDKNPSCYVSGEQAVIKVKTEPGVYLYIINIASDNTATLLYPNSIMPDQKLTSETFVFPPKNFSDLSLHFYTLDINKTENESIKVIASRSPIDFSFLPIPENQIYSGASGGDIKRIIDVLNQIDGENWNEQLIYYRVGKECEGM